MGHLLLIVVLAIIAIVVIHMMGRSLKKTERRPTEYEFFYSQLESRQTSPQVIAGMIKSMLDETPQSLDLRYHLLEIYFDSGNKEQFLQQARAYSEQMPEDDEQWPAVVEMGRRLFPHESLFNQATENTEITQLIPEIDAGHRRFADKAEAQQPLEQLAQCYLALRNEGNYLERLDLELVRTASRPTPLQHAAALSGQVGGAQIFLKREDLALANARLRIHFMGQAWIARRLGKKRLIFAASSGIQAIIAAQAAARIGLKATIYVTNDPESYTETHRNRLGLLSVELYELQPGTEDIRTRALDAWLQYPDDNYMLIDLAAGPHPYPTIAADLQTVIGRECLRQIKGHAAYRLCAVLCRGENSSDAIGLMEPLLPRADLKLFMVTPENGAPPAGISESSETMEFPRVRREHAWLKATGRIHYENRHAESAEEAMKLLARNEGLISAWPTCHVLSKALDVAASLSPQDAIIVMYTE